MKPFSYKILIFQMLLLIITSCTQEAIELPERNPEQELLREIALIVGNVIKNQNVKNEVLNSMSYVDEFGELVSISFLMGNGNNLKKNEISAISILKNDQVQSKFFRNAIINEFNQKNQSYPVLNREMKTRFPETTRLKSTCSDESDYLTQLLVEKGYQIYFPYFSNKETREPLESFYVSYDPLNGSDRNEGFYFECGKQQYSLIREMDNEFIHNKPVFGLIPIDPCDIPGKPCVFTELVGLSIEDVTHYNTPLSVPRNARLIDYNFNHIHVTDDKNQISTQIPWIRVTNKNYLGFLASHQKLVFIRVGGESPVSISSSGTIEVEGRVQAVAKCRMRVWYINKKKWFRLNGDFDSDWRMSKNTQSLAVFSIHNLKQSPAEILMSFHSGFGLDSEGQWISTPEPTCSGTEFVRVNKARFRAVVELSRQQVFLTNIGKAATGKEFVINSVPYNVKGIGNVEYVFNHWHTSLTD